MHLHRVQYKDDDQDCDGEDDGGGTRPPALQPAATTVRRLWWSEILLRTLAVKKSNVAIYNFLNKFKVNVNVVVLSLNFRTDI